MIMREHDIENKGGTERVDSFIILPGEALKSLHLELSNLLGDKLAAGVLFRFGYRCGEAFIERVKLKASKKKGIGETILRIWSKTGLGNIVNIENVSEEELIIQQEGSIEARAIGSADVPSCDYTRGYLAGIANRLTEKKFYCVETECISEGNNKCHFQLLMFPHKVYVPKKSS